MKDRHHRKPTSRGGSHDVRNISVVRKQDHQAYHLLFRNMLPNEVAKELTAVWIDPDYYLVAVPRKKSRSTVIQRRGKKYLKLVIELEV